MIFPPILSMTFFNPQAAPKLIAAIKLWPHACPMPGRASYSQRKAIVGPGISLEYSAQKEVSMLQKFCVTVKPWEQSFEERRLQAIYSSSPSSGLL